MKKIIIQSVIVAVVIFCIGFIYYKNIESNANRHIKNNFIEAKRIYDAIPIWHKKIQTQQDLKIGIITDTHVHPKRINRQDERDEAPRYLSEKHKKPITNFVSQMNKFQPESIVHLGDVIEGTGDEDFVGIKGIKLVEAEIKKAGVPIYWVIGNHDLRSLTKKQFKETLNLDSLDQVIDKGDYRFIILDANFNTKNLPRTPTQNRFIPGKLPPQTLEWFKKQLETNKRVFVFMHQGPFIDNSTGDGGPTKQSIKNAKELHEILKEYRVDGIFNGHMEARRFEKIGGTSFYSLTGTKKSKKYPDSYYELTITDGKPNLKMFYATEDTGDEIIEIDFENDKK